MAGTVNKQRILAFGLAALLYIAVIAGVGVYLLLHGENTVQRRMQMTPHAEISLVENVDTADDVPDSWKEDAAAEEVSEEAKEIAEEADAVEQAAEQDIAADAEQKAVEDQTAPTEAATETPKQETAPAAVAPVTEDKQATPAEPQEPAVSINHDAVPVSDTHVPVWKRNARPFNAADKRPRIALIIADLGLAKNATDAAVQDLPGEVTLAFSSLVPDLDNWFAKARAAGHELVLTVPMEPNNYPQNDPGPNALLLSLENVENIVRLKRALDRTHGFVGVTPYMGEKFVTNEEKMAPVMQVLREKELLVLDHSLSGSSVIAPLARLGKMPFVRADLKIDAAAAINSIEEQLAKLETIAKERGYAVGIALPYPVTFERLKLWIAQLDKKGIALAPLTAVVTREPAPVQVMDAPKAATAAQ